MPSTRAGRVPVGRADGAVPDERGAKAQREAAARAEAQTLVAHWLSFDEAEMRGWYDIVGFGVNMREDAAGIRESCAAVTRLIDREVARGIPPSCIVLAGFSQGGALALLTLARLERTRQTAAAPPR